jgi:exonuclease III
MRLVCWNVNKRVRDGLQRQVQALEQRRPDVVGLQEITATTTDRWLEALAEIGLLHGVSSLDQVPEARTQNGRPAAACCWRAAGRSGCCRSGLRD